MEISIAFLLLLIVCNVLKFLTYKVLVSEILTFYLTAFFQRCGTGFSSGLSSPLSLSMVLWEY